MSKSADRPRRGLRVLTGLALCGATLGLSGCSSSAPSHLVIPPGWQSLAYHGLELSVPSNWVVEGWPLCGSTAPDDTVYELGTIVGHACLAGPGSKSGSHVWLSSADAAAKTTGTTEVNGLQLSQLAAGPQVRPGAIGFRYGTSVAVWVSGPLANQIAGTLRAA